MRWSSVAPLALFLAMVGFLGLSMVAAQNVPDPAKDAGKCGAKCATPADGAKDGTAKDAPKDGTAKDGTKDIAKDGTKDAAVKDGAKEEWLEDKPFSDLMSKEIGKYSKDIKNALKDKKSDAGVTAGDSLAASAAKILKFHKKEVREAKDYQGWESDLETQAKEFSKAAKKSDWTAASAAKDKIGTACGNCHKVYKTDD